ncbi:D-2-hydroxyacid dehydrogenase family protein [Jiella mangrovi]|uniref:D-2-hydroxyacid dehydrogenase family protein n=1 Tax=Jiella mangrovi TaxID=2821407 RepID=A0ABS4BJD1_9HYPH|nr:D-2-hydroxyacid dehydrogenase family protein [Jiella mangrovi]MBP0616877.1 D-2-hydroxyacid dehydrogenase family protein [Jiella mangrovi]
MTKIAVLDDYQGVALSLADWSQLGPDCEVTVFRDHLADSEAALAQLAGFDVLCLMRERMALPADLIAGLDRLKLVVVTGRSAGSVDLGAATSHGVTVCHTAPGEGGIATPELAFGLILSAMRSIPQEHLAMREGGWQETVGTSLNGKTLGLLGLGRTGQRMAKIAGAFDMKVIAWSPNLTDERAEVAGVRRAAKTELFETADVVSLHLVLSQTTRRIVGAPELAAMKPGALLVNTSRGPLIDEAALLEALRQDRIRAALDVYDTEPLPADHPLRSAPNVILTPHLGYVTEGGLREFYESTIETIAAWREGRPVNVLKNL